MNLRTLAQAGWRPWHVAALLALAAAGVIATLPAWQDIVMIARREEDSSHIFLVPLAAAWLVWVRRARLRYCPPTGQLFGPLLVVLGWATYMIGYEHGRQAAFHGGALLVFVGCVLSVLGTRVLVRVLPAVVVLAFLIPVPGMIRQQIADPLQTATAASAQAFFEIIGVPVERSSNVLIVNGIEVAVAEACNGLRMVFALFLVSFAFAYSLPLRNGVRVLVLVASPLAAVACNVVRLIPTVWLYGYSDQGVANRFHDMSGWFMLPIAFLLLLGIVRLLRWALIPVARFNLAYQ